MAGWIKVHRRLMKKAIWKDSTPEQKVILIALMMMANHQGNEWEFNGKKFEAKPGQFVTSLDSIVEKCGKGVSIKNVRTAIDRFSKLGFLANQSTKTNRLITICNWDTYQTKKKSPGKAIGKEPAISGQSTGKEVATIKNDKKVENDKKENTRLLVLRDGTKVDDIEFNMIFSDVQIDAKKKSYPLVSVPEELKKFKEKIFSAPDRYSDRDSDGLRLAFDYQLRNAKPQKNAVNPYKVQ